MNTMKWLVKREFWENKGGFFWAPIWIGGVWTFLTGLLILIAVTLGVRNGFEINGVQVNDLSGIVTPDQRAEYVSHLANGYQFFGVPIYLALCFVIFFFCLGALYDERKDRSVLFWKSLPISDSATTLSKVLSALVVAPLISIGIASIASLVFVFFVCIAAAISGLNVFGAVLSSPAIYLAPLQMLAIIPVYVLWALPTVGWLLMVSAWSRAVPFLWAIGVPLISGTFLAMFNAMFKLNIDVSWFWQHIVGRMLVSVAPGSWYVLTNKDDGTSMQNLADHGSAMGHIVATTWQQFATPDIWIGAVAGAAMIYVAMKLRRWKDEG
jgi:ABC-2 type transport system permease protein